MLLRTLAGLDVLEKGPSGEEGSISLSGKSMAEWKMPEYRTRIGYVPQHQAFPDETVEECFKRVFTLKANQNKFYDREKILLWLEQLSFLDKGKNNSDKDNILATQVPTIFTTIAYQMNAPILFGGYDHFKDNPDGSYFKTEHNAALFVNTLGQLEETYHKHILIPFGETLPFGPLNEPLSKVLTEMAFFKEGEKKPIFETKFRKISF